MQTSLSLISFGLSSSAPERYSAKPKENRSDGDATIVIGRCRWRPNANGEWRRESPIEWRAANGRAA